MTRSVMFPRQKKRFSFRRIEIYEALSCSLINCFQIAVKFTSSIDRILTIIKRLVSSANSLILQLMFSTMSLI